MAAVDQEKGRAGQEDQGGRAGLEGGRVGLEGGRVGLEGGRVGLEGGRVVSGPQQPVGREDHCVKVCKH